VFSSGSPLLLRPRTETPLAFFCARLVAVSRLLQTRCFFLWRLDEVRSSSPANCSMPFPGFFPPFLPIHTNSSLIGFNSPFDCRSLFFTLFFVFCLFYSRDKFGSMEICENLYCCFPLILRRASRFLWSPRWLSFLRPRHNEAGYFSFFLP